MKLVKICMGGSLSMNGEIEKIGAWPDDAQSSAVDRVQFGKAGSRSTHRYQGTVLRYWLDEAFENCTSGFTVGDMRHLCLKPIGCLALTAS